MDDEPDKGDDQSENRPADPSGSKPIVLLALVENDLEASCPDCQQPDADIVERTGFSVLDVRRVVNEAVDHEDGQYADRDVDVEGVPPTVSVCEPAPESGSENRRHDYTESEDRHRGGSFAGRKAFQKNGLREWL